MRTWPGSPYPLGATYDGSGTNFALFSEAAERVDVRPTSEGWQDLAMALDLRGEASIGEWNPPASICTPRPATASDYGELYGLYLDLYANTKEISHVLARRQKDRAGDHAL